MKQIIEKLNRNTIYDSPSSLFGSAHCIQQWLYLDEQVLCILTICMLCIIVSVFSFSFDHQPIRLSLTIGSQAESPPPVLVMVTDD